MWLSDAFIMPETNFQLPSQTVDLHEFAKGLKTLHRHACNKHEWGGGKCTFHALKVCSCGVKMMQISSVMERIVIRGRYSRPLCIPQPMKLSAIKRLQNMYTLFTPFSNEATWTCLRPHTFSYAYGQSTFTWSGFTILDPQCLHCCSLTWLVQKTWSCQCLMVFIGHLNSINWKWN